MAATYRHDRDRGPGARRRRSPAAADATGTPSVTGDETAAENARLYEAARDLAARLSAIQHLSARLNRIHDVRGIGEAIVAEARSLIDHDNIRVYRVIHETGMCEPIAFQGQFMGIDQPTAEMLRCRVGEGLTGWVAEHNQTLVVGDAENDPRRIVIGPTNGPESMLLVPMAYDERVEGVIVLSKVGCDRFTADHEATLSIFAGHAAQAFVNADNAVRVRRQQEELEHQLASQRRLLEVNETLLSTLDPREVLEMIADSLKAVVAYDSLTIYRIDREAGVRRAVVARDRFADMILEYVGPLGIGITGWVIERREAVLANDAHLDPRSIQIPGTPYEPESMIVVPLGVGGQVIGTLNIGRMGEAESHFTENEFELTKLFAGQASIALQNAETHRAVEVRAELDALTGLHNHGAFQRELGELVEAAAPEALFAVLMMDLDQFKAFNDGNGHPAGDALLKSIGSAITGAVREGDRAYRYGGDEFAVILPGAGHGQAHDVAERIRRAVARAARTAVGPNDPHVTISVGIACHPLDGRTKDALVEAADDDLYLAKPSRRTGADERDGGVPRDAYLSALNETAVALMDRLDPQELLETIVGRAADLMGTPHGYIDLADPVTDELVVRVGIGLYSGFLGYRLGRGRGVSGRVWETGRPMVADDYDTLSERPANLPRGVFGSVVGIPLTSEGRVMGVLGLASGDLDRAFGDREVAVLQRFAQLASLALDNAHLFETARREVVERARVEEALRASEERFKLELSRSALYDRVTGLPNRALLLDRVAHSLSRTRPDDDDPVALILLDLDRFKVINESLGHAAGDRLLEAVARRLEACLRPGDTVSRFGGDEFAILVDGIPDAGEAGRVAERVEAELAAPFDLDGRDAFVTASMGIAMGYVGPTDPGDLVRDAEVALYRAKSSGTTGHALFGPGMSAATAEQLDLENDLRRAVERDELVLHYQPLVDLATDRIVGLEALVRWQHPTRGLIAPLSFIPLAEETGLILPIGRWVLETACRQAREWQRQIPAARPWLVSVNLSGRQFAQADLVEQVAEILAESGLEAACLELEITESVLMDETEDGIRALAALRELGMRLVLDDFGTGYSSLSYLKHLPLDAVKIDRSFVAGLTGDDANQPIVRAVIALAHGLGIDVVAEGIETAEQLAVLRELLCDRGQGYHYAQPVSADQLAELLRADLPLGRPAETTITGR